jgi:cardiolipin synthase
MAEPSGNSHRWLRTGDEVFPALIEALNAARVSIRLETYIYAAGEPGETVRTALIEAVRRGVAVQVMVDAIGSFLMAADFWTPLTDAGGMMLWFNPISLGRFSFRDHRKMVVCDDSVAFIGGFNFAPEYQGDGVNRGWRDLGIQVNGPIALELAAAFNRQWARANVRPVRFTRLRKSVHPRPNFAQATQLLLSGPGRGVNPIKAALMHDFHRASDIGIICAYFLPTWRLRRALMRAVRRGARVRLILAGKSDVRLSQLATRGLYRALLRAGIEIYEYQPQILHAKLMIMDDVVYLGSANLDPRSLLLNYELLVRFADARIADEAWEIFAGDLKLCRKIEPASWKRERTFWHKLAERWASFLLRRVDPWLARRQIGLPTH